MMAFRETLEAFEDGGEYLFYGGNHFGRHYLPWERRLPMDWTPFQTALEELNK